MQPLCCDQILTATPPGAAARYGAVKRLRFKPLRDLDRNDKYLRLRAAEREGLLTVRLELRPEDEADLTSHLREMYCNNNVSVVSQAWNALREGVLKLAVKEMLLKQAEQEAHMRWGGTAAGCLLMG